MKKPEWVEQYQETEVACKISGIPVPYYIIADGELISINQYNEWKAKMKAISDKRIATINSRSFQN